eukprot:911278-Heterocapsa_arctica.AAC.1
MGWRRLVRGRCIVRVKASRTQWKISFHRRKWLKRAAAKKAAGVHTANHTQKRIFAQGQEKWLCTTCAICGTRPIGMGQDCTGPPEKGS